MKNECPVTKASQGTPPVLLILTVLTPFLANVSYETTTQERQERTFYFRNLNS